MNHPRNAVRDATIQQMEADGFDVAVIAHELRMSTNAVRLVLSRAQSGERRPVTRGSNVVLTLTKDVVEDLNRVAADRFVSHRELACQIVHEVVKRGLVSAILDGSSR